MYLFRQPNKYVDGIWISYDDTQEIREKAIYVNRKQLGGIAIHDLSMDDFKGICDGYAFPILNIARTALK